MLVDNRRPLTAQGFTNASSKHALAQVHERTQQKARERRPLMDALVQVPHQNTTGHEGMLTLANALARVHNNFADTQGK